MILEMRGSAEVVPLILLVAVVVVLSLSYLSFQTQLQSSITGAGGYRVTALSPPIINSVAVRVGSYGYELNVFVKNLSESDHNVSLYLYRPDGTLVAAATPVIVSCSSDTCTLTASFFVDAGEYTLLMASENGYSSWNVVFPEVQNVLWCDSCSSCNLALLQAASVLPRTDGNVTVYLVRDISSSLKPCIDVSAISGPSDRRVVFDGQQHTVTVYSPTANEDASYAVIVTDSNALVIQNVTLYSTDTPCAGTLRLVNSSVELVDVNLFNACTVSSAALSLQSSYAVVSTPTESRICSASTSAVDLSESGLFCDCEGVLYWYDSNEAGIFPVSCSCSSRTSSYAECTGSAG